MALPAIRALKQNLPGARLCLVTKQYLSDVFQNIDEIDEIIAIPNQSGIKSIFKAAKKLAPFRSRAHAGLLFTNSFSSALLFKLAGIKKTTGCVKDMRGFLLHEKIEFPRDRRHHIYFYLDLAQAFLEKNAGRNQPLDGPFSHRLAVTGDERREAAELLSGWGVELSGPVIGISPSAAYGSAKTWPPQRFAALIQRIVQEKPPRGTAVLLFGSAKEREKISRIIGALNENEPVFNLAGRLSLRRSIAAMSLCHLFVSNDSGLMHVAASLDLPLVALFGPTQSHKTGPLNENAAVIHYPGACPQAPCLHRDCPVDHPCMNAIAVDEVSGAITSLLEGKITREK
jgi:heptosyltransferase-2